MQCGPPSFLFINWFSDSSLSLSPSLSLSLGPSFCFLFPHFFLIVWLIFPLSLFLCLSLLSLFVFNISSSGSAIHLSFAPHPTPLCFLSSFPISHYHLIGSSSVFLWFSILVSSFLVFIIFPDQLVQQFICLSGSGIYPSLPPPPPSLAPFFSFLIIWLTLLLCLSLTLCHRFFVLSSFSTFLFINWFSDSSLAPSTR